MTMRARESVRSFNEMSPGGSRNADRLHECLRRYDVNFASGVPCGVLRHVILNLEHDVHVIHVPANRESEAVGLAAGAYLGGKHPVVYMQNSGLFSASNDIASLLMPYRLPVFLVVSYRGSKGEDAVQHLVTGRGTPRLLDILGVKYRVYESGDVAKLVSELMASLKKSSLPVCLLLKRGWDR